jgi:hypothetical protein
LVLNQCDDIGFKYHYPQTLFDREFAAHEIKLLEYLKEYCDWSKVDEPDS